ncbi:hypothetical protein Q2T42_14685 [Leptolyngbya boryana CZ1]|uniref:Lipoprotein n=1 Tax=Leptolyngbya boryana CZ1 TaxID=3060204 RepID=A0AA96X2I2_LEPBY|nr:hypothetical protein [Leptolyngbya boryana]WNZ49068.1 hypothetical protein Q2T42_14685 [Leptolyngbya boryana CZ1]
MKSLQQFLRKFASSTLISLLILCTGCTQMPFLSSSQQTTTLSMQVEATGETGVYKISGQTNLPEQTQITVQAIRALQIPGRDVQIAAERSYSILAKTQVSVEKGKWQISLNLLQPGQNGALETWQQSNQELALKFQPDNQVRFLALTDPTRSSISVQSQAQKNQATSVQFTADGKSYLQTEQWMSIEPPTAKVASQKSGTTVVKVSVQPVNKVNDVKEQIDAALPVNAFMR